MALVAAAMAASKAPVPYCFSKPLFDQFPLAAEEVLSHDMATSFTGYNLNISLLSQNSFATLSSKWEILDSRNAYFPGIISHYVEPRFNSVGRDSFLLYKDLTGTIFLSYGIIRNRDQLPDVTSTTIVTNDKNVNCYDAALFLEHGLAIVDCARAASFGHFTN
ncbi:unnamed protein product [Sphagnum balticum]